MLSMSSESVEERDASLLEGENKIESSELSNQKEADILNRAKSLSAWVADKRNLGSCSSKPWSVKSRQRTTWRTAGG